MNLECRNGHPRAIWSVQRGGRLVCMECQRQAALRYKRRKGIPPRTTRPLADRLWEKVDRSGGPGSCWPFTASLNVGGYGRISTERGRFVVAHRAAYELLVGPIPAGLQLDHLCRTGPASTPRTWSRSRGVRTCCARRSGPVAALA